MNCTNEACRYPKVTTKDSRSHKAIDCQERIHVCPKCGHRFTTIEIEGSVRRKNEVGIEVIPKNYVPRVPHGTTTGSN